MSVAHETHDDHGHGHHEELSFWRNYVFSTDHKVIGIQYAVTALCFLLFPLCLRKIRHVLAVYLNGLTTIFSLCYFP